MAEPKMKNAKLVPDGYWLVWSNEHNAYWRPNKCGYTQDVAQAGRYPVAEADSICQDAEPGRVHLSRDGSIPPEVMVPAPELTDWLLSDRTAKSIVDMADTATESSNPAQKHYRSLVFLAMRVAASYASYPDWLFDGCRVFQYVKESRQPGRTSEENVSDVLDAIKRLIDEEESK